MDTPNELIKPRKPYLESAELLKRDGGATAAPANGVIVYTRRQNKLLAAYFREGNLEKLQLYRAPSPSQEDHAEPAPPQIGEVYLGKVTNVSANLNAAFVDVQKGVSCYLPLGKRGGTDFFRANRPKGGPVKAGDEILVQVTKEAVKTKQPMVSGKIKYETLEPLQERASHVLCYERLVEAKPGWISFYEEMPADCSVSRILTDDQPVYEAMKALFTETVPVVDLYTDARVSLSTLYSLETRLAELTQRRVWLKSGGYLVIEQTEAMTVIDVNSGKCLRKNSPMELKQLINAEAAQEVFRQLRLRNLSGMILVDFISLDNAQQERAFLDSLREMALTDPVPTMVHDITALGIVEITRKKTAKPLREQL